MLPIAEYVTPELVQRFEDIGGVALAVTAIAAVVVGIARIGIWLDHRKDDRFAARVKEIIQPIIDEATLPIKPGTNGGLSLTDLHTRLGKFEDRFSAVEAKLGIKDRREYLQDTPDLE